MMIVVVEVANSAGCGKSRQQVAAGSCVDGADAITGAGAGADDCVSEFWA